MKNYNLSIAYYDTGRVYFTLQLSGITREYRTNTDGQGLWQIIPGSPNQIRGTCQFSTTGKRSTDRRRFLKSVWNPDME